MSECVVRMEMPEDCFECPFGIIDDTEDGVWCNALAQQSSGQREDCPIICQLPEGHGELIERQPIIQFIEDGLNRGEYGHDQIEVMTEVFVAETIVPAEAERSET